MRPANPLLWRPAVRERFCWINANASGAWVAVLHIGTGLRCGGGSRGRRGRRYRRRFQNGRTVGTATRSPAVAIRQVIYATNGKPTVYMLGLYRSDRHTLLIRRFRNGI